MEIRRSCMDRFQADAEPIIIVNGQAGGLSCNLQDTHGDRARYGLVSLPESAQILLQEFGRLHRIGGMSPAVYELILAAGTMDERVYRRVMANKDNIEALTDEDIDPLNDK
jgi:hypothetical protein